MQPNRFARACISISSSFFKPKCVMAPQFLFDFQLILLLLLIGRQNMGYKMPNVNIEMLNEQGLKISIPDEAGMQRVFVMLQVDGSCPALMDYLTQANNGSWTSVQRIWLQNDDKLQVSLLVQYNNNIYEKSETRVILNTRFLITQERNTVNIWRSKALETLSNSNEKKCQLHLPADQKLFKYCKPTNSITSRSSSSQVICQGELLFEDDFSEGQLNSSVWMYDIRQRMYYVEEELVAFDDSPRISYLREGHLHIVPMVANEVTEGVYKLGDRCTAVDNRQLECSISKGSFFKIKPPVYSAQLHTRKSFSFKYGKIVVRAKLPKGDWLFPYMMLQPVSTYAETHFTNQLRIAYARGNEFLRSSQQDDISGHRLYGGIIIWQEGDAIEILKNRLDKKHYGDDFHNYTMIWQRDKLTLLVDDDIYGEIYDGLPFFNEKCFIIFGVTVGGFLNFKDSILLDDVKPYKNKQPRAALSFWEKRDTWASTWTNNSAMIVDYVRVYAN